VHTTERKPIELLSLFLSLSLSLSLSRARARASNFIFVPRDKRVSRRNIRARRREQ